MPTAKKPKSVKSLANEKQKPAGDLAVEDPLPAHGPDCTFTGRGICIHHVPLPTAPARVTAADVLRALAECFAPPNYAFLEQVRNGTGWSRSETRTADAIAMGLWPSQGLYIHGFEVKVSTQDLRTELANPQKADAIGRFCDYWWLVTTPEVYAHRGQVPLSWGVLLLGGTREQLLGVAPRGAHRGPGGLTVVREATLNTAAAPPDRFMFAAIFRRLAKTHTDEGRITAARAQGYKQGRKDGAAEVDRNAMTKLRSLRMAAQSIIGHVDKTIEALAAAQAEPTAAPPPDLTPEDLDD